MESYSDFFTTIVINEPNMLWQGDNIFSMFVKNPKDAEETNCL